ncbi:MAG: DUF2970 domain-containing protein [Rhodospirillales bacterium]
MSIWRSLLSVLQAFFGVQSSENRHRDFEQGNPTVFLILGLVVTVLFLVSVFMFVNYVVL